MIYAVTFNPTIDRYLNTNSCNIGETNTYSSSYEIFGGKAINVSSILSQYDCEYQLVTKTTSEFNGKIIKDLKGVNYKLFNANSMRINYKINHSGNITEINGQVTNLEYSSSCAIMNYINEVKKDDDYILFAGSLSEDDILLIIDFRIQNPTIKILIDSASCSLEQISIIKPYLFKPNLEEIAKIFGLKNIEHEEIETYANKLLDIGVENLAITLGGAGSMYMTKNIKKNISIAKGKVINTVGAGDSFVAGYMIGSFCNMEIDDKLKLASACGCATSYSEKIGLKKDIEKLKKEIIIK